MDRREELIISDKHTLKVQVRRVHFHIVLLCGGTWECGGIGGVSGCFYCHFRRMTAEKVIPEMGRGGRRVRWITCCQLPALWDVIEALKGFDV